LIEVISRKISKGEYSEEQVKAIHVGIALYNRGFNVVPVTSSGKPVSALIGVDITSRLPLVDLLNGFIDVGFKGVAVNNTTLPGNPGKLLYVIRAEKESLGGCKTLRDIVNNTVSWDRGGHVEALVVVDRSLSSRLLLKPSRGGVELCPPSLLVVAGEGVAAIREFDFDSTTLGIRELSEEELSSLLRELGILRGGVLERRVEFEFKIEFKELDDAGVEAIKNTLLEVYRAKPEYRNDIVYCFTVLASNFQVSPESIARVVKGLLRESGDDSIEERAASMIAGLEDVNIDVEYHSKRLEEVLGVKLESLKTRSAVRVKNLEEILREALGEERARVVMNTLLSELEAAEYAEVEGEEVEAALHDKLREVVEKLPELIREYCNLDINEFAELKRVEKKAACVYRIVSSQFNVVKVPPKDTSGASVLYAATGDLLYDIEEVVKPVVGALIAREGARKTLVGEVVTAAYSTGTIVPWYMINPLEYLKLANGVLDLETLRLVDSVNYYFTHRLPVKIRQAEIDLISSGRYNIEENAVYKHWRSRFDDENWDYLVSSLGAWLAPFRSKHIAFLIGETDSGKSTLMRNLTRPISLLVGYVSLRSITGYIFGLEPLLGKQLVVYPERGEVVLKNLDVINTLFGEQDYIIVHRKNKPAVTMRSLKAGFFSMNDPPIVYEYGGGTMSAFLNRLSIIQMNLPEYSELKPNFTIPMKEAFKFLLWCRVRLEENNWRIKKMDDERLLDYLMRSTNSVLQFLNDSSVVEPDPNSRVKGTTLYEAYVKWCSERGITPVGRNSFYTVVVSKYPSYMRDKSKWFKGLKLRENYL
jgi:hypothetical protein